MGWVCGLQPPIHLSWVTFELPAPSPHCLVTPPHLAHCCTSRRCLTLAAGTTGSLYHSARRSLVSVLPRVALSRDLSPGTLTQRLALPLVGEHPSPREGSGSVRRHLQPGLKSPGFQAGGDCRPQDREAKLPAPPPLLHGEAPSVVFHFNGPWQVLGIRWDWPPKALCWRRELKRCFRQQA